MNKLMILLLFGASICYGRIDMDKSVDIRIKLHCSNKDFISVESEPYAYLSYNITDKFGHTYYKDKKITSDTKDSTITLPFDFKKDLIFSIYEADFLFDDFYGTCIIDLKNLSKVLTRKITSTKCIVNDCSVEIVR